MQAPPDISRHLFIKSLEHYIGQSRGESTNLGLLLIDIANLAKVNHYFGFAFGDEMLAEAHDKLLSVSKLPDTVFRVGGHHFGFILPGLTNPGFIALAINKVNNLLIGEFAIQGETVPVDVNMGIAVSRSGDVDAMGMLAMAESSLAHVRRGGDYQFEESADVQGSPGQDFQLEKLFRETLHENEFNLYYQPKINLNTGKADHAEALLRWQLPDGEFVAPDVAVELADSLGSGFALTKWVVHTAARQIKAWQEQQSEVAVAVNVQANLVSNPDLPALIEDTIAIWGIDESLITIEVTESAIIEDKESGFNNLLKLRDLGIDLSIDDFGTGYSSMAYLKHIPARELKIDRHFVSTMKTDPLDRELVRIMIDTAHLFGLRVVAEGVEDQESLDMLIAMQCDYVQGYFFTRPLPAPEFEAWLRDWPGLPS